MRRFKSASNMIVEEAQDPIMDGVSKPSSSFNLRLQKSLSSRLDNSRVESGEEKEERNKDQHSAEDTVAARSGFRPKRSIKRFKSASSLPAVIVNLDDDDLSSKRNARWGNLQKSTLSLASKKNTKMQLYSKSPANLTPLSSEVLGTDKKKLNFKRPSIKRFKSTSDLSTRQSYGSDDSDNSKTENLNQIKKSIEALPSIKKRLSLKNIRRGPGNLQRAKSASNVSSVEEKNDDSSKGSGRSFSFRKKMLLDLYNKSASNLSSLSSEVSTGLKKQFKRPSLKRFKSTSDIFAVSPSIQELSETEIAAFHRKEIQVGKLLGKGSFSNVHEIAAINLRTFADDNDDGDLDNGFGQARRLLSNSCENKSETYAIKSLKNKIFDSDFKESAMYDLDIEARLLASLDHENIIKIYGLSTANSKQSSCGASIFTRADNHFIVMEKLGITLEGKIKLWELKESSFVRGDDLKFHQAIMVNRKSNFALQIADALSYIHAKRIIFRDLKPQNVAFKDEATVKLFDFGLARELPEGRGCDDELYYMSIAGTQRYMAPEILNTKEYNTKADVYSWSMLFYEMLVMNKPFAKLNMELHRECVCVLGERPEISHLGYLPQKVKSLLRRCWAHQVHFRPSMVEVCNQLREILQLQLQPAAATTNDGQEKKKDVAKNVEEVMSTGSCCSSDTATALSSSVITTTNTNQGSDNCCSTTFQPTTIPSAVSAA